MRRRGSFELSAEMIVVMIIALAILGMGMVLVRKIFISGTEDVLTLDEQTERQLFDLLDEGGRVVNPFDRLAGPDDGVVRGDMVKFGIGVRNVLDDPDSFTDADGDPHSGGNRFNVTLTPSLVPDGVTKSEVQSWVRMVDDSWTDANPLYESHFYVTNNERELVALGVSLPRSAPSGTYAFNLDVFYVNSTHNGEPPLNQLDYNRYFPTDKLYIIVE